MANLDQFDPRKAARSNSDTTDTYSALAVKPMNKASVFIGDLLTCAAPAALLAGVGMAIGGMFGHPYISATLFDAAWAGILLGLGLKFPSQQEFLVIERFNQFKDVKFGFDFPNWINPFLDRVAMTDDFKAKRFALYETETPAGREFATP